MRAACREAGEPDPIDEATDRALRHHNDRPALWTADQDGFAVLNGDALDLAVRPEARRRGIATALAEAALADHPGHVEAWSHAGHPGAAALARHLGLEKTRELWVMRSPLDDPAPAQVPDGVAIRSYRPADEAELLRVNAAAFAHHPEQGAMDAADLAERMSEPWYDPADLLVADRGDRLGGFHWTKRHSETVGEIYVLGVDPDAQGLGLGRVLTAAGLRHLADRGVREVLLYVEADNERAVRLYSGAGFTHAPTDTHVRYSRP